MYPDLLSGDYDDPSYHVTSTSSNQVTSTSSHLPQAAVQYPSLSPPLSMGDDFMSAPPASYPSYVDAVGDGTYRCLWCDAKLLASEDQLVAHLQGKEHTKRCANSGISPFGAPDHDAEVTLYVAEYGHNPYARMKHWPACIQENDMYWACTVCGNKKFQTQRGVNDHLIESSHIERSNRSTGDHAMAETGSPISGTRTPKQWPQCIVDDGDFWSCTVCGKKFNSEAVVDDHLQHPKHVQRVAYQAQVLEAAFAPVAQTAAPKDRFSAVKEQAATKQRLERLARFIDFDTKACSLCEEKFESVRDTENHIDDLIHIAHNYEFTIDNIA